MDNFSTSVTLLRKVNLKFKIFKIFNFGNFEFDLVISEKNSTSNCPGINYMDSPMNQYNVLNEFSSLNLNIIFA